jgi:hypothetical protein
METVTVYSNENLSHHTLHTPYQALNQIRQSSEQSGGLKKCLLNIALEEELLTNQVSPQKTMGWRIEGLKNMYPPTPTFLGKLKTMNS